MRRSPFVLGATVAGLAGVLTFHTRTTGSALTAGSAAQTGQATTPGTSGGQGAGGSGSKAPSGSGASTTPSTAPSSPSSTAPSSPSSTAPSGNATATAVGRLEQYGYGELSVKVTVAGHRITAVSVVGLRTAEAYSQQIARQVIPMLRSEVLNAQSARINGISGATYTCEAYDTSLQSALDKLHFQ